MSGEGAGPTAGSADANPFGPGEAGERRQVTVLFTDLVGYTAFSERAGEEATYALVERVSKLTTDTVREHGGVATSFTGDGIMALFGYPAALEDAPLRACRAALAIQQRLTQASPEIEARHGLRAQLRIGINTGPVVIGAMRSGEHSGITALGDTVNLAARVQALAAPGTIMLTEATHRLVDGLVNCAFAGDHSVKGKTEPQRLYRLDGIKEGASRFTAAEARGLSPYVGRERELDQLEAALAEARNSLRVIDIVAEPGIGKSRLLYEFRRRLGKERAFFLSGSCSADGQQTPFLPFVDVVRRSFQVSAGEAEQDVSRKLDAGLTALGLLSPQNLGILLNLLGLKPPQGALAGLDGVLIGLRTRDLLFQLLENRCRLSPVVMAIEDLHWLDSASEEVLHKLVDSAASPRLLLLHSRRPEYTPPWLDRDGVSTLPLEPLPLGDIRRLVGLQLGINGQPDALSREVAEKADGNPLFAEEMVSFLSERGVLRNYQGHVDFDARAVAATLPPTVEGLLRARVDCLAAQDRALLQAASVIGRQFDPELLAAVCGDGNGDSVAAQLAAMQTLGLVRIEGRSNEHSFKHALVRDALYQSLLSEARRRLHLRIAEEIERRSGNRLIEVAEILAHHYRQTGHAGKAFTYLAMAGAKSLSVYSLDEATTHFTAAQQLLDDAPDCATDDQVSDFLVGYTVLLNMTAQIKTAIAVLDRYLARVDRLADDGRAVIIRHHYAFALLWNTRYDAATIVQRDALGMAERLGDSRSKAYALAGEILISTIVAPKPAAEFASLRQQAITAAAETADAYIQNWTRFAIAWEEFHQGRMSDARQSARDLIRIGRQLDDPRSTGLGLCVLALIALLSDAYAESLDYAEQAIVVAVTPFDRETALNIKGCVLTLLRRREEGMALLVPFRERCLKDGDFYSLATSDSIIAVSKVIEGRIGEGVRMLRAAIAKRESEGYRGAADWYRLFLAEVYLQIIGGDEKVPLVTVVRNLPILLAVMATASSRIAALMAHVLENPRFHADGHFVGRAHMILGLLHKAKHKRAQAQEHLTEARRILSHFGETPMLTRVDAALTGLAG